MDHRRDMIERYRAQALFARERAQNWDGLAIGIDWDRIAESYEELAKKLERWLQG
ncbi:MAG TPA: hypothetical protein VH088_04075 [Terriglobales bacterium]|jgi:hypothetical protein|nr:hypothetical protein [Terriglobales bacterium]